MKTSKLISAATLLLLGTLQAQAAQVWTVTAQGFITSGVDTSGVFGTPGQQLRSLAFSQTITASVDPALWGTAGGTPVLASMFGTGPGFTSVVTVDGHRVTFTGVSTESGGQTLDDARSAGLAPHFDLASSQQQGHTANGDLLYAEASLNGYANFVPTLDFGQAISVQLIHSPLHPSVHFSISGSQSANFESTFIDSFGVNTVSAVPEPSASVMLLAGLAGLACLARRQRRT
ncbi:MAG: PEP-CTERM sorting domain-containing protein [Pseudomonadota bacterium]